MKRALIAVFLLGWTGCQKVDIPQDYPQLQYGDGARVEVQAGFEPYVLTSDFGFIEVSKPEETSYSLRTRLGDEATLSIVLRSRSLFMLCSNLANVDYIRYVKFRSITEIHVFVQKPLSKSEYNALINPKSVI